MASSKIEEIIDDITAYIDSCKYIPFSNTDIRVDKEIMDDFLRELKAKTPDEIKRYQKIISNKEAIMADAEQKAKNLVEEAHQYINSSVNEHEIMQQAYAQAGEIIQDATDKAQDILDQAAMDADNIRLSAIDYTDDSLANIQSVLTTAIETTQARSDSLVMNLQQFLQKIVADRAELHPEQEDEAIAERAEAEKLAAKVAMRDGAGEGASLDIMSTDAGN